MYIQDEIARGIINDVDCIALDRHGFFAHVTAIKIRALADDCVQVIAIASDGYTVCHFTHYYSE